MASLEHRSLVVLEPHELEAIVEGAVRRALATHPQPDEWLDSSTAAEILGINVRTLTKRAASGDLPAARIGRLWRFRRSDVEGFVGATIPEVGE